MPVKTTRQSISLLFSEVFIYNKTRIDNDFEFSVSPQIFYITIVILKFTYSV